MRKLVLLIILIINSLTYSQVKKMTVFDVLQSQQRNFLQKHQVISYVRERHYSCRQKQEIKPSNIVETIYDNSLRILQIDNKYRKVFCTTLFEYDNKNRLIKKKTEVSNKTNSSIKSSTCDKIFLRNRSFYMNRFFPESSIYEYLGDSINLIRSIIKREKSEQIRTFSYSKNKTTCDLKVGDENQKEITIFNENKSIESQQHFVSEELNASLLNNFDNKNNLILSTFSYYHKDSSLIPYKGYSRIIIKFKYNKNDQVIEAVRKDAFYKTEYKCFYHLNGLLRKVIEFEDGNEKSQYFFQYNFKTT